MVNTTLRPLLYYHLCDFYEAEENYCLSMELPGISKEDVDISMSGDSLVVKVKKKHDNESEEIEYVPSRKILWLFLQVNPTSTECG